MVENYFQRVYAPQPKVKCRTNGRGVVEGVGIRGGAGGAGRSALSVGL